MATPYNIVVLVGSLRKESFTLKIAKALSGLAPDTLKLDVVTLHNISFFNQDLEAAPPADWVAFREKLHNSKGVLFVTPEYNRSIPGGLKNAMQSKNACGLVFRFSVCVPMSKGTRNIGSSTILW